MLSNSRVKKWVCYWASSDYVSKFHIALHKFLKQCEIIFKIEIKEYIIMKSHILLAQQYLSETSYNDWNWVWHTLLNFTWVNLQKCLKIFLRDTEMKRQNIYKHYMRLHQQKSQFTIDYLKQLKKQLLHLNDEVQRSESLLIKFKLELLQLSKNCIMFLSSKKNYKVNKLAT